MFARNFPEARSCSFLPLDGARIAIFECVSTSNHIFKKVFWLVRMLMVWRVKYIHVVCCKQWLRGMFTIFSVVDDIFLFLEVIFLFQDFLIHEVCHKLYLLFIFCSYLLYQNLSFFFKRKYAANLFIEFYLFLKKRPVKSSNLTGYLWFSMLSYSSDFLAYILLFY